MTEWSDEETDDPKYADKRDFYKVEQWTRDGLHIIKMLYAGNSLDTARAKFDAMRKHRPGAQLTIRQGVRVLAKWPHE